MLRKALAAAGSAFVLIAGSGCGAGSGGSPAIGTPLPVRDGTYFRYADEARRESRFPRTTTVRFEDAGDDTYRYIETYRVEVRDRPESGDENTEPVVIELPFSPEESMNADLTNALVRRYSISHVRDRAVVLVDIVGFSLLSPLEQVTQLNSLSYSVNAAHSRLMSKDIDINFARTTTGDGFYIWNRASNIRANQ